MKILIAALCLASCISACAQDPADESTVRDKILALENAWNQAEEHKDSKALDSLLAKTLVYVDYDGTLMNKAEFLASVKRATLHPEQIINEQMATKVYGDTAIVTGLYREKGALEGKPYVRHGRFTDTWVNFNGTWQCVASQSTLLER
jgi:ketosteroid isomerase-like protein